MSFRNRPVLDRKHHPRWQDELRSQQLILAAFAVAIAMAIGIYGAVAWNGYYDTHLKLVAAVNGAGFNRDELATRAGAIGSELQARGAEIQAQLGGARDQIVNQQLQVIQDQLSRLDQTAADSIVQGAYLGAQAPSLKVSVSPSEVESEVGRRQMLPLRLRLGLITINALPANAKANAKPSDAEWAKAKAAAQAVIDQLNRGADFAAVAKAKSADPTTSQSGGLVGWVEDGDAVYGQFFTAAKDAKSGAVVGPVKGITAYAVVKVLGRRDATHDKLLSDLLSASGVSADAYRAYVRDELLRKKFETYFGQKVVVSPAPQRRVAQIVITADQGTPVPKLRLRHLLVMPIPGQQDQSKATPAQWKAALAKALKLRAEAIKPGADWNLLAKQSDDPGSRSKGGDLGWYDPTTSGFVPEFKAAITRLKEGVVSEPVKTQFGYHLIEITDRRVTAGGQASTLVDAARKNPASFATLARQNSEDTTTAGSGGEVGWVARYELDPQRDKVVFGLKNVNDISNPITVGGSIYIYKLEETSQSRVIPADRLDTIRSVGFPRWLDELKAKVQIWVDPQFQSTTATA